MTTLQEFLAGPQRNAWAGYVGYPISLYLRKSHRILDKRYASCLDLASIDVAKAYRGQGLFKGLLPEIEHLAAQHGFSAVFVENILEPRLLKHLTGKAYQLQHHQAPTGFSCLYKFLTPA